MKVINIEAGNLVNVTEYEETGRPRWPRPEGTERARATVINDQRQA